MGTAVLRSHDCLNNHFFGSRPPPPMNPSRKKPPRTSPQKQTKAARSRPNPARLGRRRFGSPDKENPEARKPLVMEQVSILKRGEEFKSKPNPPPMPSSVAAPAAAPRSGGDDPSFLCSINRLGPDPKILPKLSDLKAVYAGPAYISSPAPSSLPFPAFFLKKASYEASDSEIATKGLRCLLRLDEIA